MTVPAPAPAAVVVLAAGAGTRMRSATPKVLHGYAGRSLLGHVLAAAAPLGAARTVVVVGHGRERVVPHLAALAAEATPVVQDRQGGTGHAVALALAALDADGPLTGPVVVLPGDTPLLRAESLAALVAALDDRTTAAMLTSEVADPTGYGRVLRAADGSVAAVVEHKDASEQQRAVREIAAGVYAFDAAALRGALPRVGTDNAQGEQYLPDVVGLLVADGARVAAVTAPEQDTAGVNDRVQLAAAARAGTTRLLEAHMRAGVTVVEPTSTWVDVTVELAPDVELLPGSELRGATRVAAGAVVGPQTTLVDTVVGAGAVVERTVARGARIGARATVGPFAHLRPGTELADDVHVGAYVEIKGSSVGAGSKVPHLSYVGDATIGEGSNIGAATVFVNYDGVTKSRTTVGDHVRIGSDSMLVAPVSVGDGAYTAAGSVVVRDVPPGALARSTARQENVAGWVVAKRPGTAAAEAAARSDAQSGAAGAPSGGQPDAQPDRQGDDRP